MGRITERCSAVDVFATHLNLDFILIDCEAFAAVYMWQP